MAAQLGGNKLAMGMAISVLAHLLVLFSFGFLLRLHAAPKKTAVSNLNVRLVQHTQKIEPHKPGNKLLSTRTPAQFKVAQASIQGPPVTVPQPTTQAIEKSPPPAGGVTGVAFPGAAATPWSGQPGASNPIFHANSFQQEAVRIAYQQTMAAQDRQQSEQQAQFIIMQLQKILLERLDVQPVVTGKCTLAETNGVVANHLACDTPALHEVLLKDEKNLAEMLMTLRRLGRLPEGFSASIPGERLEIVLIER